MKAGLLLSLALFLLACCLPVLEFRNSGGPNSQMWGANVLIIGWSGLFVGVIAWYANICWLVALLLAFARKSRLAALTGFIGIALGATTFSIIGQEMPADEGNVNRMAVTRVLPGGYLWLTSLAILPITALTAGRLSLVRENPT